MLASDIPVRISMPCPFAADQGAALTPISSEDGNAVNFHKGFPTVYGAPASGGGKYITRGEMNAIGNLASNDLFRYKCGGLNTYDEEFAVAIGGYPMGAILDIVNDDQVLKVLSLKDNNLHNYLTDGIDNIWWRLCNTPDGKLDKTVFFTTTKVATNNSFTSLGCFKAVSDQGVSIEVTADNETGGSTEAHVDAFYQFSGIGIMIADCGGGDEPSIPDPPGLYTQGGQTTWEWNGWQGVHGASVLDLYIASGQHRRDDFSPVMFGGYLKKDHWYALICSAYNDVESTLPEFITDLNKWKIVSTSLTSTLSVRLSRI